jgi:hypothetical protein
LLRAGVDINTIRAWLGHVSLDTTNIYAEIDLEMKCNRPRLLPSCRAGFLRLRSLGAERYAAVCGASA